MGTWCSTATLGSGTQLPAVGQSLGATAPWASGLTCPRAAGAAAGTWRRQLLASWLPHTAGVGIYLASLAKARKRGTRGGAISCHEAAEGGETGFRQGGQRRQGSSGLLQPRVEYFQGWNTPSLHDEFFLVSGGNFPCCHLLRVLPPSTSRKNWALSTETVQLPAEQTPFPWPLLISYVLQPLWQPLPDKGGPSPVHRCPLPSTCRTRVSLHHPPEGARRDLPKPTDTTSRQRPEARQ